MEFILDSLDIDQPGFAFRSFLWDLEGQGIHFASNLMLISPEILATVGDMGYERAERLLSYTWHHLSFTS